MFYMEYLDPVPDSDLVNPGPLEQTDIMSTFKSSLTVWRVLISSMSISF